MNIFNFSLPKLLAMLLALAALGVTAGCAKGTPSSEKADNARVQSQQKQYAAAQPIIAFDWSLERHLTNEVYRARNQNVGTHSVWRSDYGTVEGDCPSIGYGLPYDTSLTNPLQIAGNTHHALASIEQAEPNGVFASKNTTATWVMCADAAGGIAPIYVESKVTVYPGEVDVNYTTNRVRMTGVNNVKLLIPANR